MRLDAHEDIDRIVHEPARLTVLAFLSVTERVDFVFLLRETGLTKGNLGAHLAKLEGAEYIEVEKKFVDKRPCTTYKITDKGKQAFLDYRDTISKIIIDADGD